MLTKDLLKKFLYAYIIAIILVAVYFVAKLIFHEEKTIEYKSFNTPSEKRIMEQEDIPDKEESPRFILLPKR